MNKRTRDKILASMIHIPCSDILYLWEGGKVEIDGRTLEFDKEYTVTDSDKNNPMALPITFVKLVKNNRRRCEGGIKETQTIKVIDFKEMCLNEQKPLGRVKRKETK